MSMLDRWECPTCFGLTGYPGERARRHPLRAHLVCKCSDQVEHGSLELTEVHPDPLLNRRAA